MNGIFLNFDWDKTMEVFQYYFDNNGVPFEVDALDTIRAADTTSIGAGCKGIALEVSLKSPPPPNGRTSPVQE